MSYLIIMSFECVDLTGKYLVNAIVKKKDDRYIVYYPDFDNIISILKHEQLNYIPATIRNLLAEESGIIPKVKFLSREIWAEENPLVGG